MHSCKSTVRADSYELFIRGTKKMICKKVSKSFSKWESKSTVSMIMEYLRSDFESSWRGIVLYKLSIKQFEGDGFGNYLFSLHALIMLESALFYCASDRERKKLVKHLFARDPRYKTSLATEGGYAIQNISCTANTLIALIFDLVRNGHAHDYSTKPSITEDRQMVTIGPYGITKNPNLFEPSRDDRLSDHLELQKCDGSYVITLRPDVLFHDIWSAIREVGLDKSKQELTWEIDRKINVNLKAFESNLDKMKAEFKS